MDPSTDRNGIVGGGSRPSETPPSTRLCVGGCGFFGTAKNEWLCSKCYKDSLKVKMAAKGKKLACEKLVINENCRYDIDGDSLNLKSSGDGDNVINNIPLTVVKKKNRCGSCNKKVGLLGFECRCRATFCGTHRYPEMHSCRFDYKEAGKITIEKENPPCKADKLTDRI